MDKKSFDLHFSALRTFLLLQENKRESPASSLDLWFYTESINLTNYDFKSVSRGRLAAELGFISESRFRLLSPTLTLSHVI